MQIGSENRKKVMWAGGLGAVALLLIVYELVSSPSAPVTAAQPVTSPTSTAGQRPARRIVRGGKEVPPPEPRLDPTLDLKLLAETEGMKYTGSGRNIFVAQAEVIPQPVAPPVKDPEPQGPPQPPPPPPPPPITLKFLASPTNRENRRKSSCRRMATCLSRSRATSWTGATRSSRSGRCRLKWKTCCTTTARTSR